MSNPIHVHVISKLCQSYKMNGESCLMTTACESLTGSLQLSGTCPFASVLSFSTIFSNRLLSFSNFAASLLFSIFPEGSSVVALYLVG